MSLIFINSKNGRRLLFQQNHPILLLLLIFLTNAPLNGRPFSNTINPLQQVRERLHVVLTETGEFPPLDPRPGADIRNAVFALAVTCEVLAWGTGVFA